MESFFDVEKFKSLNVMESIFNIKNLKTVTVSFFSIKNFKSCKKVTESFSSGHSSLSFHMMQNSWNNIFSISSHWIFLIIITFNLLEERCRGYFSKYCKSLLHTSQQTFVGLEDVLKTCLEDVLKTYLEDVFKTSRRQTKSLLVISVSNKSKCISNKSMFHKSISDKSKANPKCVT